VHNAQGKHVANILNVIGGEQARRLGFDHMSPERELKRWRTKYLQLHETLEHGLATKKQGLDHMRRQLLPGTRLYDIADYYYKVRLWPCSGTWLARSVGKRRGGGGAHRASGLSVQRLILRAASNGAQPGFG
jgi:hypothetical protein